MVRFVILFSIISIYSSCRNQNVLQDVRVLERYPSASGIECSNDTVFIIGDDAKYLLITDSALQAADSILLYNSTEQRLSKDKKADLEAITVLPTGDLLLTGSGSLSPFRNTAWLIHPSLRKADSLRLDTFYQRLTATGISEINIEGLCAIPNSIILSNRGNNSYRKNYLVFTEPRFWENQSSCRINTVLLGFNTDTSVFSGVSGLDYSKKTDRLFVTVSTEDTKNSYEDGTIGKSYLWIIKNISGKTRWKAINPDIIIDLEKVDLRFRNQKIESVCVVAETKKITYLLLAADNDNGSSSLFKLAIAD